MRTEKEIRSKIYDTEQDLIALCQNFNEPDPKTYQKLVARIASLRWVINE